MRNWQRQIRPFILKLYSNCSDPCSSAKSEKRMFLIKSSEFPMWSTTFSEDKWIPSLIDHKQILQRSTKYSTSFFKGNRSKSRPSCQWALVARMGDGDEGTGALAPETPQLRELGQATFFVSQFSSIKWEYCLLLSVSSDPCKDKKNTRLPVSRSDTQNI